MVLHESTMRHGCLLGHSRPCNAYVATGPYSAALPHAECEAEHLDVQSLSFAKASRLLRPLPA